MNTASNHGKMAPSKPWVTAKDFTNEGLTVRVTVQDGYRPKYSAQIGKLVHPRNPGDEMRFAPHVPLFIDVNLGRAAIRSPDDVILGLLAAAKAWTLAEAQLREDTIIEEKQLAETKDANRNKPTTRHTGKTQRNKEKRT